MRRVLVFQTGLLKQEYRCLWGFQTTVQGLLHATYGQQFLSFPSRYQSLWKYEQAGQAFLIGR